METTLHRQLKEHYARRGGQLEVRLGRYRIDVVAGDELVEIQHGSLAAIRDKVQRLLQSHCVRVVKPIVVRKQLMRRPCGNRTLPIRRLSPKRGTLLDLFDNLVYFTRVFPHPNLVLEVPLVEIEEWRCPGHGRRRRRRASDYQIEDQVLTSIQATHRFRRARDLLRIMPASLPVPFHTGQLAESLSVSRWTAQRIAYCLRHAGAAVPVGRLGNARLYAWLGKKARP